MAESYTEEQYKEKEEFDKLEEKIKENDSESTDNQEELQRLKEEWLKL